MAGRRHTSRDDAVVTCMSCLQHFCVISNVFPEQIFTNLALRNYQYLPLNSTVISVVATMSQILKRMFEVVGLGKIGGNRYVYVSHPARRAVLTCPSAILYILRWYTFP